MRYRVQWERNASGQSGWVDIDRRFLTLRGATRYAIKCCCEPDAARCWRVVRIEDMGEMFWVFKGINVGR